MKKLKFRKLSRVLISISLLAIIAVSLISVPVSAADGDYSSLVGEWYVPAYSTSSSFNLVREPEITGTFKFLSNGSYVDVNIESVSLRAVTNNDDKTDLTFFGTLNGYTVSAVFLPRGTQYKSDSIVIGTVNDSNSMFDEGRYFTITSVIDTVNVTDQEALVSFLTQHGEKQLPPLPTLLDNILGTFSEVGSWIGTIISSLVALFWSVETASLTFLGILSVAGLAFSTIMLLFGIVTRFVGFSS